MNVQDSSLFLDLWNIQHALVYSRINCALFKNVHHAAIYKYVFSFGPSIEQTSSHPGVGVLLPPAKGRPPRQAGPATPSPAGILLQPLVLLLAQAEATGKGSKVFLPGRAICVQIFAWF